MKPVRFFRLLLLFLLGTDAILSGQGLDFMDGVIEKFEGLRGDLVRDYSEENRKAVSEKARELAIEILDIDAIGELALGSYAAKIKTEEKNEFKNLFHELMANRVVAAQIPSRQIISKKIPITVKRETEKKDTIFNKDAIIVFTNVPHKRVIYEVDFYLYKTNKGLKLYDIHLDGSSTLLDFRNQFARIISTNGIKYLIKKLKTQIAKLDIKKK